MEALSLLKRCGKPMSAYDLLEALRPATPKIAPPTVYRALSALMARGAVHRVETMNAFVACRDRACGNALVLSVCDDCGAVEENVAPELVDALYGVVGKTGFASARHVIEVRGLCAACDQGQAGA